MSDPFIAGGVAVITGGASGIGRAAARRAAAAGMAIALVDVNGEKLAATAAELRASIGAEKLLEQSIDVADAAQIERCSFGDRSPDAADAQVVGRCAGSDEHGRHGRV